MKAAIIILLILFCDICVYGQSGLDFSAQGCYLGAFVNWETVADGRPWEITAKDIDGFEQFIGRDLAILSCYAAFLNHGESYYFPLDTFKTVNDNGSIFLLTWEPRDWDVNSPYNYEKSLLPDIIAGKQDSYIDQWARDIKALPVPVMLRFAPEMNLKNLAWSGANNGGAGLGPERYVTAFRHVHDRFKAAGVNNVVWVWTPVKWGLPFEPWNHYTNYYPGDKYVDVIAMDEYNWGKTQSWSNWQSFNELYWQLYSELTCLYPDKPLMIGEFSSAEKGGEKAAWIKEAFATIKEQYPKIKAFIWFNVDNRTKTVNQVLENSDWRINSSTKVVEAAKQALADKYFLSKMKK